MSCLHLLTCHPLPDDFTTLGPDDEAVLLAEGVYLVNTITAWHQNFAAIYAVQDDMSIRGLEIANSELTLISNESLVELVLKHEKSITW